MPQPIPQPATRSPSREAFNKAFFASVRHSLFSGSLAQGQVDAMNGILDAFETHGDGHARTLAYALATARHEVGPAMKPVRESFAATDAEARKAVAGRAYGKPAGPYGHVYYGRGQVQLTWHENYVASSADAGTDLEKNPDAMLDPEISARILVAGLIDGRWNKQKLSIGHYLPGNAPDDLEGARRAVNLTDKWQTVAEYYRLFLGAVLLGERAAGAFSAPPATTEPEEPGETLPVPSLPEAGALTLDMLRAVPSGDLRLGMRQAADLIKLATIVLDERASPEEDPKPEDPQSDNGKDPDMATDKTTPEPTLKGTTGFFQSSGVIGALLAIFGAVGPMIGIDLPVGEIEEGVNQASDSVMQVISGFGALLALWGRLKATARISGLWKS